MATELNRSLNTSPKIFILIWCSQGEQRMEPMKRVRRQTRGMKKHGGSCYVVHELKEADVN